MSKLAFVDTHVHFWDLQHPDLAYYLAATRLSCIPRSAVSSTD